MFGKEYASHLNLLMQSFGEINECYEKKALKKTNNNIIDELKKKYILLFGIPEIGFQIRAAYFKKILFSNLVKKNIKNILDAGSGIGAYSIWLAKNFNKAKTTGGEIDKNKLNSSEVIRKQLDLKNVNFVYFDIMKSRKKPLYDLIICIDVLEHIDRYKIVLKNFYDMLQNNGYLYIHVPQPNQKRIFTLLKTWHHEDHIREGITKNDLENSLKKLGYKIIVSKETFGFFGKLAWEINHLTLSKSFVLSGIFFPFLFILGSLDPLWKNSNGLGIAILAKKE